MRNRWQGACADRWGALVSAALLNELLADYVAPARDAFAAPTPANAANAAKREHSCGLVPALAVCEGLRIPANQSDSEDEARQDSQTFAGVRMPEPKLQDKEPCGSSQDSQKSQGCPMQRAGAGYTDLAAVAWTDADIARFLDRRTRLMRWGWAESDAENLAERLVTRDRERDDRVSCAECAHYRPGDCGNHRRAVLHSPDLGRDLLATLQRCPGFQPTR
jgi:hypothetical protein